MINRVVLVGRLTRDADLRSTKNGVSVATFNMAVNRTYTNNNGERQADFLNCVIWRKAAENFTNFTHKGSLVGVEGRLQTRTYDNNEGQKVYVTEVVVDNFSLLESKKDVKKEPTDPGEKPKEKDDFNYNYNDKNKIDPFEQKGNSIDIDDADMPF